MGNCSKVLKYETIETLYGGGNISKLSEQNQRLLLNARKYRVPKQHRAAGKVKDMYDNVYLSKEPSYIKLYYSHKFTCKGKVRI